MVSDKTLHHPMGEQPQIRDAWVKVNKALLQSALHRCKKVTLDIDATEIVAHKAEAQWTYNKNKGFMPMVGHIAETGQVVAVDFRKGNYRPRRITLRWRLYAIAEKVVKTGRQLFVKLKEKHRTLLEQLLIALKEFEPPPI